jgi:hypothetical protein
VASDLAPSEAADSPAIRALFDGYAHCADRRHVFTEEGIWKMMIASLRCLDTFAPVPNGHTGTMRRRRTTERG